MDNYQAIGYMLLACKRAGLDLDTTQKIYSNMYYMFDMKTEEEAETQGFKWYRDMQEERYRDNMKSKHESLGHVNDKIKRRSDCFG